MTPHFKTGSKASPGAEAWRVAWGILLALGMCVATAQTVRFLAERAYGERWALTAGYLDDVPAPNLNDNPLIVFCP